MRPCQPNTNHLPCSAQTTAGPLAHYCCGAAGATLQQQTPSTRCLSSRHNRLINIQRHLDNCERPGLLYLEVLRSVSRRVSSARSCSGVLFSSASCSSCWTSSTVFCVDVNGTRQLQHGHQQHAGIKDNTWPFGVSECTLLMHSVLVADLLLILETTCRCYTNRRVNKRHSTTLCW